MIVVVGTPAAYLLATRRFRGRALLVTLVELPLVLPPAVAGIGLLAALGPSGLLGGLIEDAGLQLALTTAGVVVALTFVAAPFYLRQAQAGFEALDTDLARRLAHARGGRGAHVRARRGAVRGRRARRRPRRSPGAGRSASSARR